MANKPPAIVIRFETLLGETRWRFASESTLHPGKLSRSLKSWKTESAAKAAATRAGFRVVARGRDKAYDQAVAQERSNRAC